MQTKRKKLNLIDIAEGAASWENKGYPLPRAKGGKGEDTCQKTLQRRFPEKLLKSKRTQIQNPWHISSRATKRESAQDT